ncbi:MAG TPA: hypothetical protein VLD19_06410 [Chitinophagaceae bacterium]|nr:hypothetical protein [Chitinophagaceae bacterium]
MIAKKLSFLLCTTVLFLTGALYSARLHAQAINPKKEYAAVLKELTAALLARQLTASAGGDSGAIECQYDHVLHTRAAEAMFPFAVEYTISKNQQYLRAAINAGNWLIRQQQPNGSWKETPEEWTGTSTDQLLMMLLTYDLVSAHLSGQEKLSWTSSMQKAADYLTEVMSPEFASINYVATTTATLAKAALFFGKPHYMARARILAHRVVSKMDGDGFVNGEGGRTHNNKWGVDLGYAMEMSLWGLGYYAKLSGDELVNSYVKKALKTHLYFIYPDGSMDGSWGIRSNKWTGYGGATSDGCQVLFSLYANEDPRYVSAGLKNLAFLRTNIHNGLAGYGPQHWEIFATPPCIYPTFTKAKNIAFAYELETQATRPSALLPTEKIHWMKLFKTIDVAQVRTKQFMATITSYGYKDYVAGAKSKYMYRPSGGAISNLWLAGHGYLQASSPTFYSRPEPMSFPEAPGTKSLTPRMEYTDTSGYFTNLFEFDSRMTVSEEKNNVYNIAAWGDLKDKNWLSGGVGYRLRYSFSDNELLKTVTLIYHDAHPVVSIVEPFINYKGTSFTRTDSSTVIMVSGGKKVRFRLLNGNARLVMGENADKYWTPYPALKAFPIELRVNPGEDGFEQTIRYSITVLP